MICASMFNPSLIRDFIQIFVFEMSVSTKLTEVVQNKTGNTVIAF